MGLEVVQHHPGVWQLLHSWLVSSVNHRYSSVTCVVMKSVFVSFVDQPTDHCIGHLYFTSANLAQQRRNCCVIPAVLKVLVLPCKVCSDELAAPLYSQELSGQVFSYVCFAMLSASPITNWHDHWLCHTQHFPWPTTTSFELSYHSC